MKAKRREYAFAIFDANGARISVLYLTTSLNRSARKLAALGKAQESNPLSAKAVELGTV